MSLPPQYEARSAELRIQRGLEAAGCPESRAQWASVTALAEAPFGPVTEEGWACVCQRARQLASQDDVVDDSGYGLYPARFHGRVPT